MRRWLVFIVITLVLALGIGEAIARFGLGLGTPPLSVPHSRIEYMFAPDQDVRRFGNRQLYNGYGMRSPPVAEWSNDRRVLVFGDSVLNGGNQTDHAALATTRASNASESTVFANISAGSWGPDNFLGWIETYGLLDAEAVILVLSSHDGGDAPSFAPLNPTTHPTQRPISALWEGMTRYAPRYLPASLGRWLTPDMSDAPVIATTHSGRDGLDALPDLTDAFARAGIRTCVILHTTREEMRKADLSSFTTLIDLFVARQVPTLWLTDLLSETEISIETIYRDNIHINDAGQRVLEIALLRCDASAAVPIEGAP